MHHLFIYLFIYWSNRMVALLLCYQFTALCTSKSDISASAICCLQRFIYQFIAIYVNLHRLLLLFWWPFLQPLFLSALIAATCSQPTTLRQLNVGMPHEHSLLRPSIFHQVSSDHRCCGQGSPVPKLGIFNSTKTSN